MTKLLLALILAAAPLGVSHAVLIDRGGGLIYDDVLNVTWLQDANYGAGSSFDDGAGSTDGLMTVVSAATWAANLNYYDPVRDVTWSDWRLPMALDTGTPGCNYSYVGTDCGFNVQTVSGDTVFSELAYMFHVNLGNLAFAGVTGASPQSGWGLLNTDPFINLRPDSYWLSVEQRPGTSGSWYFHMSYGNQITGSGANGLRAWAVRDGDVAPAAVPEPGVVLLMFAGLSAMYLLIRKRRSNIDMTPRQYRQLSGH